MSLLKAIVKEDRFGNKVFICPLCGHVFYKSKQYTKHLMKSHLKNIPMKKRKRKKFLKQITLLKIKKEQGLELTRWEKILELKLKLTGYKI